MFELSAMVLALTEMVKRTKVIPNDYLPFVAILFGVWINMYQNVSYQPDIILAGMVTGLTVSGLYSVASKIRKPDEVLSQSNQ